MSGHAHIDSHYARTANPVADRPPLDGDAAADVCVVGGGLAGLSAALGLAERGKSVVLLEANRVAWGASGRNGGFVAPGFSLGAAGLVRAVGQGHARALYDLSREAVATIRRRIGEHAIDCAPVFEGYLKAAWRAKPGAMEKRRDFLNGVMGAQTEYRSADEMKTVLSSPRYHAGLFDPAGFHMHPLNYALGLAAAIERKGGNIFEQSAVTNIEQREGDWIAATAGGAVRCAAVVLCGGGYTDHLVPALRRALVPVATYVMVTKPLGATLGEAIRTRAAVADTRRAGNYYRVLPEGRLLWGGGMTALTGEPPGLAHKMQADMVSVFPQLAAAEPDTAWSGLMGYARHQMPQIGEVKPGLWHATAFGGHGLNTTTMAGETVAAAIAGGDDRYRLFAPFGLAWTGGRLIGAVAAEAAYAWYKLRDAID